MEQKLAYSELHSLFKVGEADFDIENRLAAGNGKFIEFNICFLFSVALQQFKEDGVYKTPK